ncbi:MAG: hypothetical protein C6Y22_16470 [Hapalosiphonaceae cyanobacterium JJU2]|nr:MAG: hypothetical protein C6Y22_16470 [Hapalosiphonaceae cyanobacterium JJU2]
MVGSILRLVSTPEKKTQIKITPQTDHTQQKLPQEVYSITYAMSGQVGLCVPRISRDSRYLERLQKLLQAEALVTNVQINSTAASVVVTYNCGEMSDEAMRSHLIHLIQSAAQQPVTIQPGNSHPHTSQIQSGQIKSTELEQVKEAYSITYAMPGQVGFCVPRISRDDQYQERLVKLLKAEVLVTKVQINITAASIVVIYKSGVMSDYEMRSHLVNLIQSGTEQPATIQPANSYPTVNEIKNVQKQDQEKLPVLPASSHPLVTKCFNATAVKKMAVATITERKFLASKNLPQVSINKQASSEIHKGGNQSTCLSTAKILPVSSSGSDSALLPQKTQHKAKQPAKVAYSIAHVIPGRIRFHVPRITRDPQYVQSLEALLKADPTVIGERINRAAGSIVITYKSAVKAKTTDQDRSVLEAAISHLANLLQSASDLAIA